MHAIMELPKSLAFLAVSLLMLGCASGGAGSGLDNSPTVRMDMGVSTATDMLNVTQDLLRRQNFLVFRTDQPPVPLVESEWRNQTPFPDEQAKGIHEVRCKVIVRGRERPPQGSLRTYQVTYTMDVQVKTDASAEWVTLPLTPQRTAMAEEFGRELSLALEVMRR